ncbi:LamG domain-containing protein [Candidatus Peregrinibacteria bacterium]|nr:MAG: LamG domain-containing protein [Candidatus Peregrinibacteria bacterium]
MPLTTSLLLRGRTLFLTPLISIVALLFFFLPFSSASASSCTWNGTTSTDWATSTNWTNCNSTTPQSTDDVIINGSYTNPPTLNLSGGAITINSLSLGSSASSTLTVSNGDTSTKKLIITNNATIGANGTLTHTANGTSETHKLFLDIGGDFTLNSGGTINLNSKGYASQTSSNANGYGPGKGGYLGSTGAGGGYGGNGGNSQANASGGSTYGSATDPTAIGSSGGSGFTSAASGAGGGALKLVVSGTTTLNGTITANGGAGLIYVNNYGGGGGSGGSISLTTDTLTGTGTLTANGGDGGNGSSTHDGGGGGGGRIAVLYATRTFTGAITATGGNGNSGQGGGAGTIYTKANSQTNGDLLINSTSSNSANTTTSSSEIFNNITVDNYGKYIIASSNTVGISGSLLTSTSTASITNNGIYNHSSSTLTIPSGLTWKENGTNPQIGDTQPITDIIINGTLEFQNQNTTGSAVPFTSITINSGGNLTHQANSTSQTDGLNLDLTTLTLNSGGTINLNSKGYASQTSSNANGYGPGKGGYLGSTGAGGGYGGNGGNSQANASGGSTYGSATDPTAIGSSGGSGYSSAASGAGGGALKLIVSGTTTLNGNITANGGAGLTYNNYYGGGGGSGGSISLTTDTLTGTGTLTANGGDGGNASSYDGGGGGGGRIAVLYATRTFTGAITAIGGNGNSGQGGGAGTIYTKANSQTNGDLILDNAGRNGASTTTGTSDTFENITIQNYAKYIIANTHTITLLASSLTTTSNTSLTINAGGTFIADSLTSIADFTLTNNSTLSFPAISSFGSGLTITNNGIYNHSSSTLTIPSGSTWKENGTNSQIGDTQPITDIIINGTLEFQNQNTTGSAVPFTSITINSGGNLTHQANSTSQTDGLNLDLTTLTLNSGGTINLNSKGYASQTSSNANGYGPGKGGFLSSTGAGGGYGGNGGNSQANASGGSTYGSATDPTAIGSSGGSGFTSAASGAGGGALKLVVSGTTTLNGTITANGGAGLIYVNNYGGGGGSGGSISLTTDTLTGTGTLTANGGDGGNGSSTHDGGGGGGGRIAVLYATRTFTGAITATGGNGNSGQDGGAGTVYTKANSQTYGDLLINSTSSNSANTTTSSSEIFNNITVDNYGKYIIASSNTVGISGSLLTSTSTASITNNGIYNHSSSTLTIPSGLTWKENGTNPQIGDTQPITDIIINGTLEFQNQNTTGSAVPFTSITINSGGNLTHQANSTSQTDGLNLDLTTLTLNSGGTINLNSKGYASQTSSNANGYGPGKGGYLGSTGAGGGYGGNGGNSQANASGGSTYGSATDPTAIGSSGGSGFTSAASGAGGGALKLVVSGTTTLNGTITANGGAGLIYVNNYGGGGGSGGSISLTTDTLTGTGTLTANGGDGGNGSSTHDGGGGGGGRIAVLYATRTFTGAITATGGNGNSGQDGGAGTVYPNITAFTTDPTSNISRNTATGNATIESIGIADSIIEHGHIWAASAPLEPIAHWKMNDNAGNTTVTDAMGNFNGTAQRNTSSLTTTGKINEALTFNGSSDYIRTPTIALNSSFTVSFWMKPTNLHNYGDPFSAGTSDKHLSFVTYADGHIYFNIGDGSNWGNPIVTGAGTLQNDQWYHVLGVYDGAKTKLYIDGVSQGVASNSAYSLNEVLNLGARTANGYYFAGQLDDIRIYDKALTNAEVEELYNSGTGTEDSSPILSQYSTLGSTSLGSFSSNLTGLTEGVTYHTRAYITTAAGETFYGNTDVFTTLNTYIPDAPSALSPTSLVDGSFTSETQPTLGFTQSDSDIGDTLKYTIQIDDTSNFSSPIVDYTSALLAQGSASFTVGQAEGGGTYTVGAEDQTLSPGAYYWRVLSTDNNPLSSDYTTANGGSVAFIINEAPTTSFVPLNGSSLESLSQITGVASDAEDTISLLQISLKNTVSNLYYNGTSFASGTQTWLPVSTADNYLNWSYDITGDPLTEGNYRIDADITDSAGNIASPFAAFSIKSVYSASTTGGAGQDIAYAIAVDDSGDSYVGGVFQGTVDFDSTEGIDDHTSSGPYDYFVLKQSMVTGRDEWIITGGGNGADRVLAITTDGTSKVYVAGVFEETSDFDPTGGTENHTSNGSADVFVSSYDFDGTYNWTKTFGGIGYDAPTSLAINGDGNLLVSGRFYETVDFDPSSGVDEKTSAGESDFFLLALDASTGAYEWNIAGGGTEADAINSVVTDSANNIYVTGYFMETVDFDPSVGNTADSSQNGWDAFFASYDALGNYRWSKTIGGTGTQTSVSAGVDSSDNIYFTGDFWNTVDFDPTGTTENHTSNGRGDLFLTSYQDDGTYRWTKTAGGLWDENISSVSIDGDDTIFVAGHYRREANFDPDGTDSKSAAGGSLDLFYSAYDINGNYQWTKTAGKEQTEYLNAATAYGSGWIYLVGGYYGITNLNANGTDIHTAFSGPDFFMTRQK